MTKSHDLLLSSLNVAYAAYFEHGSRSTAKLAPFHEFFHDQIEFGLSDLTESQKFTIRSMKSTNGEMKVSGALYPKNVDVAVEVDGKCVGAVSLKFVVTNYKQNANNYFEHLMGETANIRSAGIPYASFSVIPIRPKYLAKAGGSARGEVARTEKITRENLLKYINLHLLADTAFKPHPLGLMIIDLDASPISVADLSSLGLTASEISAMHELGEVKDFIAKFCSTVVHNLS
jgi:hypothetical protein